MSDRRYTDLQIERHLCSDFSPEEQSDFEQSATEADRAQLETLRRQSEAFLEAASAHKQAVAISQRLTPKRMGLRFLAPLALVASVAAGLFLFLDSPAKLAEPDVATKGGELRLKVYVATDSGSRMLMNGDTLPAFSRVRFELLHDQPGFAAIVGIDSEQVVSVYYSSGDRAVPYEPAVSELPVAIELDETLGSETFYGLFSAIPFDAKRVGAELLAKRPLGPNIQQAELTVGKTR